jgi:hypothetical protein
MASVVLLLRNDITGEGKNEIASRRRQECTAVRARNDVRREGEVRGQRTTMVTVIRQKAWSPCHNAQTVV